MSEFAPANPQTLSEHFYQARCFPAVLFPWTILGFMLNATSVFTQHPVLHGPWWWTASCCFEGNHSKQHNWNNQVDISLLLYQVEFCRIFTIIWMPSWLFITDHRIYKLSLGTYRILSWLFYYGLHTLNYWWQISGVVK